MSHKSQPNNKSQPKPKEVRPMLRWRENLRPIIIMMTKKMTQPEMVAVTQLEVREVKAHLYCE